MIKYINQYLHRFEKWGYRQYSETILIDCVFSLCIIKGWYYRMQKILQKANIIRRFIIPHLLYIMTQYSRVVGDLPVCVKRLPSDAQERSWKYYRSCWVSRKSGIIQLEQYISFFLRSGYRTGWTIFWKPVYNRRISCTRCRITSHMQINITWKKTNPALIAEDCRVSFDGLDNPHAKQQQTVF